ncbi:MAG TPA: DNA repair protein RadC [Rhabdochlamydiaceae bacterium]|nr:DNA repair protein RadC [Rhabdochlamydiaceae bacterium]
MSLHNIPVHERPRERLIHHGTDRLSLQELLAILLTTGTKDKSVLMLSQEIIQRFGSRLTEVSIEELMEIKGIGQAKAIQLKAAFAIAKKLTPQPINTKGPLHTKDAYELVRDQIAHQKQEMIMVILKDVKGRLIKTVNVAVGTLSDVLIHPREIFYPAVRHKATSLILAHNHPSGDPTPSPADLEITRHLVKSSRVMGIHLDDHLIIGANSFTSLKALGLF